MEEKQVKSTETQDSGLLRVDFIVDFASTEEFCDGKRVFNTIQKALDRAHVSENEQFVIYIKKGIYHEMLEINKPSITLVGEDRDETILTYHVANGSKKRDGTTYGTSGSASVTVSGECFRAENITFENAFDYLGQIAMHLEDPTRLENIQAVALKTAGNSNCAYFNNCRFRGYQDTLLANVGTHYFKNCIISGTVDFIFGGGQAVFHRCDIISIDIGSKTNNGFITAASTLITQEYGFLFEECRLLKEKPEMADRTVSLGRPWHPGGNPDAEGCVLYKNCWMDSHIIQEGWVDMKGFSPMDARLFEYGSYGEGALQSETRRVISDSEARQFSIESVLNNWNPSM